MHADSPPQLVVVHLHTLAAPIHKLAEQAALVITLRQAIAFRIYLGREPIHPVEFVGIFVAVGRIAVRQIQARTPD